MPAAAVDTIPENLKDRLKDSYDAIAVHYNTQFTRDHDPIRLDFLSRLLDLLKSTGKENATALELGCGAGIPGTKVLLENEKPSIHVTGNDLSSTQIDLARSNLSAFSNKLTLIQGDMLQLSFPDESFDAVLGFYSVIHLPRQEQTELVKKIVKWLKPGGFFLANFSYEEMPAAIDQTWLGQEKGWIYWSGWGEEKSVGMVEEAGLEVLVREARQDVVDSKFLWVLARKGGA